MNFAHSTWLILLIILPLLGLVAFASWHSRGKRWHQLVAQRLRSRLSETRAGTWHFISFTLACLGLGFMILALATPEGGEELMEHKSEGRNILFCLDISRSMLTEDVSPSRLAAAKAAALEIMDQFPNDRAGLMVFSGETDVQVPLTIDRSYVRRAVSEAHPVDIFTGGSDLARALREGTETLAKTGQRSNVMIILSDGEEHTEGLSNAAREAQANGVFIYALGFGTKAGGKIPDLRQRDGLFRDLSGRPVHSALNDQSMKLIAQETDGVYSQGVGPAFLKKLSETVAKMESFESEGRHLRVAKPLFQWFLLPGLILLMLSVTLRLAPSFRKGALTALLLFAIFGLIDQAQANQVNEGKKALQEENYQEAAHHFSAAARKTSGERAARLHLASGAAAYQGQDWRIANSEFSEALLSENSTTQEQAHFAIANSLFYQGSNEENTQKKELWQSAIEHLKEAQKINSENAAIRENLEKIEEELEKIQNQETQEEQQKEEEKKDEQKQEDESQDDSEKQKNAQNQNNEGEQDQEQKQDSSQEGQDQKDKQEQQQNEGESGEGSQDPSQDQQGDEEGDQEGQDGQNGESEQDSQGQERQDQQQGQQPQGQENQKQGSQEQGQPQDSQLAQQSDRPAGQENPQERARRLLREHADMGRRPPKGRRFIPRRPEKDW